MCVATSIWIISRILFLNYFQIISADHLNGSEKCIDCPLATLASVVHSVYYSPTQTFSSDGQEKRPWITRDWDLVAYTTCLATAPILQELAIERLQVRGEFKARVQCLVSWSHQTPVMHKIPIKLANLLSSEKLRIFRMSTGKMKKFQIGSFGF